jgi:hypothetical protein
MPCPLPAGNSHRHPRAFLVQSQLSEKGGAPRALRQRRRLRSVNTQHVPTVTWSLHPLIRPVVFIIHADGFGNAPADSSGPNAVAVGWGDTLDDEDPWGTFGDPTRPPIPYQSRNRTHVTAAACGISSSINCVLHVDTTQVVAPHI